MCHQAKFCYPNSLFGGNTLLQGPPFLGPDQRKTVGEIGELLKEAGGRLIPSLLNMGKLSGNILPAIRSAIESLGKKQSGLAVGQAYDN